MVSAYRQKQSFQIDFFQLEHDSIWNPKQLCFLGMTVLARQTIVSKEGLIGDNENVFVWLSIFWQTHNSKVLPDCQLPFRKSIVKVFTSLWATSLTISSYGDYFPSFLLQRYSSVCQGKFTTYGHITHFCHCPGRAMIFTRPLWLDGLTILSPCMQLN